MAFKPSPAHTMTAITDHLQMLCDDALAGGLVLTLPAGVNPSSADLPAQLKDNKQAQPSTRHANASAENAAMVALATALGEAPHTVCQVLADNVLALLKVGSAGVSVMSMPSDDGVLVSWPAIAGRWHAHSGGSRMLLAPAATLEPAAEHCIVVPFGVGGKTIGTVWAVAHDAGFGFDAEDMRQLQNLALFAAPALQAVFARDPAPPKHRATTTQWVDDTPDNQQDSFNSLIENAPFGVYVVDAQFRLCQASAAARKAFDSVRPLIGRDFGEVVRTVWPEPFASEVLAHFRSTLDSGVAYAEPTMGELRKDMPEIESYDWKIDRVVLPDGGFGVVCYFYDLTEREQAAEALRLRTAQFETLFNEAPLGIYLVDADLRICQVNPVALPEFGNIPGLVGQDFAAVMQTLWGPAIADGIVQQFSHTLATGEPFEAEELIAERFDRGATACYEWQIHRIPLPDGSYGVVCHFHEISKRVQAQAEIRDSEMRFRAFVTASADVVYRMGPDWREMRQILGRNFVTDTQVPSTQWMQDYIHPEDQAHVLAVVDAAIANKSLFELEHRVLRMDGTWGWTQSRAVPMLDESGAIVEWFGTASDITEARRVRLALSHSEERYRGLFNSIDEGFSIIEMIFDADHRPVDYLILEVNPGFEQQCGLLNATGKRILELLPDHEPYWFDMYGKVALTGEPVRVQVESKALQMWFETRAFRIGGDGSLKVAVIFYNITERKMMEAKLRDAVTAAQTANRAKSDFLSHMSHELRSPLNAVLGFAQLLQSGTPPPTAQQEESVGEILKGGWYLLGLIDEILDLSLIESGHLSCALEQASLADLLDDCLALVEGQAKTRGIRLSRARLDHSSIVSVDRTRIKQVFINLLSNAIKYNREGGTVQVFCEVVGRNRISIHIEDSGMGLKPEQLSHIFKPFERLGQESGAIEGTGIGLALSKRLVELMGGCIGVRSVVGLGSVFWVELDAPSAPGFEPESWSKSSHETTSNHPREVASAGPATVGRRPCTVLSVDDNRANQLVMQRLLARRADVSLLLAGDGEQGVQMAHMMQPDVVLMDINLPGLSGLEAMAQLAADAATAHIPVIAVSALAMQQDINKGLQAGFFRYLIKPIKIDTLTEALDAALDLVDRSEKAPVKIAVAWPAPTSSSTGSTKYSEKVNPP